MLPNEKSDCMKTTRILNERQNQVDDSDASALAELLSGVKALKTPDYGELNSRTGRNDRLLHALLCAYAKHALDSQEIGWEELVEILHNAICYEIGHDAFQRWLARMDADADLSCD